MRRWISILLVLILPLQFSLAGAAGHCSDIADPAAAHVAHHGHAGVDPVAGGEQDTGKSASVDIECEVCHLGCAKLRAAPQDVARLTGSERVDCEPPQSLAQCHPAPLLRPPSHSLA
ncbi:MAG: cobalt-zinc-cadmium resistance protein [Betaproteobacteria bacterium]|nr:cobalt-zinc-cadmium resistance protein [Betaproteobacteria bacterium]